MVKKVKQNVFLKNCKCTFRKNTVVLRVYFCWRVFPAPGFISVNFDNIVDLRCLPSETNLSI